MGETHYMARVTFQYVIDCVILFRSFLYHHTSDLT